MLTALKSIRVKLIASSLRHSRASILPELEEFIVVLYGFGFPAFLRFFKYILPSFNLT
jgi:hypothetical protein